MFFDKDKNREITSVYDYPLNLQFDFVVDALRKFNDDVGNKICNICDRANTEQLIFLTSSLRDHIKINQIIKTDLDCDDDSNDKVEYKVVSVNIPSDLKAQITDLYNRMLTNSLPTNNEANEIAKKEKEKKCIVDGFKNLFNE